MSPGKQHRWVTFDCYGTLVNHILPTAGHSQAPERERTLERGVILPFSDVEPMLAELRLRGYQLGVLTNCDDALFEATHRAFKRPFDLFVTAEDVRARKPAPWHFRAFEMLTGVRKSDWVHVASNWHHDIVPAEALGIQRVWFNRSGSSEDPSRASAHVRTARDVVAAVDGLFSDRAVRAS